MRCTPRMLKPCSFPIFSRKNMGVASPMAHVQRASRSWLEARVSSRVHYKVGASKMERIFREGIAWDGWGWCRFLDFLCSMSHFNQFDPIISSYSQMFAVFSWQPEIQKFFSAREPCLVDPNVFFLRLFNFFGSVGGVWPTWFSGRLKQFYWNTSIINHN